MIRHVARRVARLSLRLAMATLRQYVSLVICVSVVGTILLLTFLQPHGQWTMTSDLDEDQKGDPVKRKISVDGEFFLAQLRSQNARISSNNNEKGNGINSSSSKGRNSSNNSKGRNNGSGSRNGEETILDYCESDKDGRLSFTREELALADIHPPNKTRKPRKPDPSKPPADESKISTLLKSRNRCWRSEKKSNKLACLPYYYLAGFPKCGSTDLFLRLTSHPDVVRDWRKRKEMHWVTRSRFKFPFGLTDALETYAVFLGNTLLYMTSNNSEKNNVSKAIIGDNSASTLWDNSQWRQIPANQNCSEPRVITADVVRHLNPRAKIIVIVRNPTDRLYSEFLYFHDNCTKELFHQYVLNAIWEATKCFQKHSLERCVYVELSDLSPRIHLGLYDVYIADWLKRFPRDQFHVIRLEDMATNRKEVLLETFAFLGVDVPDKATVERIVSQPVVRAGRTVKTEGPMLEETRAALEDFYLPFNLRLATLLNDSKYRYDNE